MPETIYEFFARLLGLGARPESLSIINVLARALIVYILGLLLVRLGKKRFIGKNAAFDAILGFMLGTILTSAVIGTGNFFIGICGAIILLGLHGMFSSCTYHSTKRDN